MQEAESNTLLHKLPTELLSAIADQAGPEVMSEDEAKSIRLELMRERSSAEKADAEDLDGVYSRVFNLCEH